MKTTTSSSIGNCCRIADGGSSRSYMLSLVRHRWMMEWLAMSSMRMSIRMDLSSQSASSKFRASAACWSRSPRRASAASTAMC